MMTKKEHEILKKLDDLLTEKKHKGQLPVARKLANALRVGVVAWRFNRKAKAVRDDALLCYLGLEMSKSFDSADTYLKDTEGGSTDEGSDNEMTTELATEITEEVFGKGSAGTIECTCGNTFVAAYETSVCPVCKREYSKGASGGYYLVKGGSDHPAESIATVINSRNLTPSPTPPCDGLVP